MGAVLLVLLRLFLARPRRCWSSAVGWGVAHSAARAGLGPGDLVAVPDLLDAVRDLAQPLGWPPRSAMAAAVHALHNLLPALLLATG